MPMKLTRVSPVSGNENTMELPLSEDEFVEGIKSWKTGAYIQDAFPTLTPSQCEFIKTGIIDEEWDQIFPDKDDYEDDHVYQ